MGRNSQRVLVLMHRKEGKFWMGCMHKAAGQWNNLASAEDQEGQEAKFQERGYDHILPALLRRRAGSYQRDYYNSASHGDLQGVKDPRGLVGVIATRKRWIRCSQPPLWGVTK
jgi:hypothetical protein